MSDKYDEMAREVANKLNGCGPPAGPECGSAECIEDREREATVIAAALRKAAEDEREACALIVEMTSPESSCKRAAERIRARGAKKESDK